MATECDIPVFHSLRSCTNQLSLLPLSITALSEPWPLHNQSPLLSISFSLSILSPSSYKSTIKS